MAAIYSEGYLGIASAINSIVTATASTTTGYSEAYGLYSARFSSIATNSDVTVQANSNTGQTLTIGVYGWLGAIANNTSISASSIASGLANVSAYGVSSWGNLGTASTENSDIRVYAESQGDITSAYGVSSLDGIANVINTSIYVNSNAPTIQTFGVFSSSGGTVTNSPITVEINGTTITSGKCSGVMSSDGSCS